mgnify:CR=1 FL=1
MKNLQQTSQFHLNQWELTDRIRMEDFNGDNQKLETALASLAAADAAEQLADLEATMRGASRFCLKNPIGVYPLEADTVTLLGANGESVILVGSQGRFAVDGYPLHDGETLLAEVQNILAS